MAVTGTDRQNDLTDVDTGNGTIGLTPSTTHTSLEPIRSGARQHLVDADNMEGVGTINVLAIWPTFVSSPRVDIPDSHVETILSGNLDEVFVGANTGCLESLTVSHKNNQPSISNSPLGF